MRACGYNSYSVLDFHRFAGVAGNSGLEITYEALNLFYSSI